MRVVYWPERGSRTEAVIPLYRVPVSEIKGEVDIDSEFYRQRFNAREPIEPVILRRPARLLDGNHRLQVAVSRGLRAVPAIYEESVPEEMWWHDALIPKVAWG